MLGFTSKWLKEPLRTETFYRKNSLLTCRRKFTEPSLILMVGVDYPTMILEVTERYIELQLILMARVGYQNTNFGRMGRYIELQLILMDGVGYQNTKYVSSGKSYVSSQLT